MTATVHLPGVLITAVDTAATHEVQGDNVGSALFDLFVREPGLRGHVIDEQDDLRPHVAVFVDGEQARLDTPVGDGSEVWILQAVSGGAG